MHLPLLSKFMTHSLVFGKDHCIFHRRNSRDKYVGWIEGPRHEAETPSSEAGPRNWISQKRVEKKPTHLATIHLAALVPWEPPLLSPGGGRGGPLVKHHFQAAKQRLEEEGETQKLVAKVSSKTRRGRGIDKRLPQHTSCCTRGSVRGKRGRLEGPRGPCGWPGKQPGPLGCELGTWRGLRQVAFCTH